MRVLKKIWFTAAILALPLIWTQAAGAQTVINFDNLSDLTTVTTQYSSLGVTFSGAVILACGQSLNCGPFPPFSFPNVIFDGTNGVITATFDTNITGNVTEVSAKITGNRNITMTAFDSTGNVLATTQTGGPNFVGAGTPNLLLTVNTPGPPIAFVTFHDSGDTYTVDDFTFLAGLRIIQPTDASQFPLTQKSFTETFPVPFEAGPIAPSAKINWTAQLEYATSGGLGAFQKTIPFTTDGTTRVHTETYTSIGGKVTINANQDTPSLSAKPITIFIVGTAIPDTDITNQLITVYGGATPNLLTGIAVRESSYTQFVTRSLFGVSALWPTESHQTKQSPHSGSHIGLMQMPVSQANAWDWLANTANGASLFKSKLASAGRLMNRIIATHSGLRQLTGVELEHMALVLYGPYASANLSAQYFAPTRTSSNGWDWVVNNTGNRDGVSYADSVFGDVR